MKISAVNGFNYANNYQNKNLKNQSFGNIVLSDRYIENLRKNGVTDEEMKQIEELSKKPINLKQLLNYDNASPEKKKILDIFFAQMPESEVDDLTVELDWSSYRCQSDVITGWYNHYLLYTNIGSKLPGLNKDLEPVYRFCTNRPEYISSDEWRIKPAYKSEEGKIPEYYDEKSKKDQVKVYETIKKEAKEKYGCDLKLNEKGIPRAIPTEDTFDYITNVIKRYFGSKS